MIAIVGMDSRKYIIGVMVGMNMNDKQPLRTVVQERLGLLTRDDYLRASVEVRRRVSALLVSLSERGKLTRVLSYHAVAKWCEVDLTPLEREFTDIRFDYVPAYPKAPFPAGNYDVILVPLYGVNSRGYRLGHGGGWYDRFLASQPNARKVGIGLQANRVDFAPEAHDVQMDEIVIG